MIDEYQLSKQRFCCLDLGRAAGKLFINSLLDRLRIESKQQLVNSSPEVDVALLRHDLLRVVDAHQPAGQQREGIHVTMSSRRVERKEFRRGRIRPGGHLDVEEVLGRDVGLVVRDKVGPPLAIIKICLFHPPLADDGAERDRFAQGNVVDVGEVVDLGTYAAAAA
jgi:hypothetical protein